MVSLKPNKKSENGLLLMLVLLTSSEVRHHLAMGSSSDEHQRGYNGMSEEDTFILDSAQSILSVPGVCCTIGVAVGVGKESGAGGVSTDVGKEDNFTGFISYGLLEEFLYFFILCVGVGTVAFSSLKNVGEMSLLVKVLESLGIS